jgi:hypothetical protein
MGANAAQLGEGTGVIRFNGGADRASTLKPGEFDGTFTEMLDAKSYDRARDKMAVPPM